MNSLPKTVTRQRRDCDLNPGPSVPESSTLTTRLPSQLNVGLYFFKTSVSDEAVSFCCVTGRPGGTRSVHNPGLRLNVCSHRHHSGHATPHAGDRVGPLPRGVLRPSELVLAVQLDRPT